jgi:hypothetical protein
MVVSRGLKRAVRIRCFGLDTAWQAGGDESRLRLRESHWCRAFFRRNKSLKRQSVNRKGVEWLARNCPENPAFLRILRLIRLT